MAIQNLYPLVQPSLNLDFANTKKLDPRVTFTRASSARAYDGKTVAKAEQNLLLQSQDFTTTWVNVNSTDAADTTTAPDGTTTADTLTDNATSGTHSAYQSVSVLANTTYVVSCFLKAGTSNFALLAFTDASTAQRYFAADFDLSTGTVRTSVAGSSGTITSATITDAGSGWYRCVIIGQTSAVGANRIYVGVSDGTSTLGSFGIGSYVGTGSTIFVWGAQLEQRSAVTAYTPTTTQPITNYIPVLLSATDNVARFDHNPTTGESLGLLVEEQRTNLVLRSEEFETTWVNTASTEQINVVVSPAGDLTGDKLVEDTTTAAHAISQSITLTATANTFSVYAKAAERTFVRLIMSDATPSFYTAYFNLSTGAVGTISGTGTTATITSVGNGWYRCSVTATTASGSSSVAIRPATANGTDNYLGDGYSGIYIWGAQLEAASRASSYIKTEASQVTRSAEPPVMGGTNFSSWYRQDQGTLYAEYVLSGTTLNASVLNINDSVTTTQNSIGMRYSSNGSAQYSVSANNVNQVSLAPGGYNAAGTYKRAIAYQVDSFQQAINGVLPNAEDTSGTVPVVDTLRIGIEGATSNNLNGHIKKISFYPARLTNAQLQALTS